MASAVRASLFAVPWWWGKHGSIVATRRLLEDAAWGLCNKSRSDTVGLANNRRKLDEPSSSRTVERSGRGWERLVGPVRGDISGRVDNRGDGSVPDSAFLPKCCDIPPPSDFVKRRLTDFHGRPATASTFWLAFLTVPVVWIWLLQLLLLLLL